MLSINGVAAIVCFPGILYRSGAEQKIRKYLVDNNFVDCIINLPDNLFYGTSVATCIMVLKKSKSDSNTLFIDAKNEYVKSTTSSQLSDTNIEHILNAVKNREDKDYYARLVPKEEIAKQDYNLTVSFYVKEKDTREDIDIIALEADIKKLIKERERRDKAIDILVEEIKAEIKDKE
jgi:type I restriction enzyme M protein